MIKKTGKNLVFLLCVPRSGSSLSTILLQNHSKVLATQEMWYLMSLYDLKQPENRPYGGKRIISRFFNGMVTEKAFVDSARAFALETYNGLLYSSNASLIVDKSPRYYYILEFIDRLFPESKRIWLIRNPLSILASYKKVNQNKKAFSLIEELSKPTFNIKIVDLTVGFFRYYDYFSTDHLQAFRLSYERLVTNPKYEVEKLCEFLNVSYEEGMEIYGDQLDSSKGRMFASMGVGDPNVYEHSKAHTDSIEIWKDLLTKEEIEAYCRLLGANVFRELGYEKELQEAEKITGARFEQNPDHEFIQKVRKQFLNNSETEWEEAYHMQAVQSADFSNVTTNEEHPSDSRQELLNEIQQMNITIKTLEQRLATNLTEKTKLMQELQSVRTRFNRFKSIIPFSGFLTNLAEQRGQKK